MAVLTARAREFLFALEIGDTHEISKQFRLCGERNGLMGWGRGPVLYGSVKEWICPSRKSERKAKNFGFLLEDDGQGGRRRPSGAEGGYVFIGDTGEGDPLAGEIMISKYPDRMKAVFLHVVSDAPRQGRVSLPTDRVVSGVPVVYFRTYVGAAAKAVELGLMDKSGLDNVITAAKGVSELLTYRLACIFLCPTLWDDNSVLVLRQSTNTHDGDRTGVNVKRRRIVLFTGGAQHATHSYCRRPIAGGAGSLEIQQKCRILLYPPLA